MLWIFFTIPTTVQLPGPAEKKISALGLGVCLTSFSSTESLILADNPSSQQMGEESAVNRAVNEMFFSKLVSHCKNKPCSTVQSHTKHRLMGAEGWEVMETLFVYPPRSLP